MSPASPRLVPLREVQPSQLYVSRSKLDAVLTDGGERDPTTPRPVPVKRYGDRLVLTDGHTRALAAYRAGLTEILVIADEDDLDDEAYEICIAWCVEAGVESIADLDRRIVEPEAYERFWLARCRAMHRELDARRGGDRPLS